MAKNQIRYWITSGYDAKGQKAAQTGIASLGKTALRSAIGIGTAAVALSKLNRLLKESASAALADQKAQVNLSRVLANAGWGSAAQQVNNYIGKLQLATGVSEDQLRPAFIQLFNALGNVSKAQETLNIAMDTATATGKDLRSVTAAIARAAAGSNTAIQRLGLGISKADLAAMSFDEILSTLQSKFGGSTAAAAETMSGKIDRMKLAVSEAKEEIGVGMIDALNILATSGSQDVDTIQTKIIDFGTKTGNVFRGVALSIKDVNTGLNNTITTLSNALKNTQLNKLLEKLLGPLAGKTLPTPGELVIGALENKGKGGKTSPIYTGNPNLVGLYKSQNTIGTKVLSTEKKQNKTAQSRAKAEAAIAREKAKQLRISRQMAYFDEELIQIAAARTRNISSEAMARLNAKEALAMAQLGLSGAVGTPSTGAMGAGQTVASQSLAQGLAAGLSLADATAGARYAGQGAMQYYGANPVAPNVTVNLNGPTIGTQVDQVVLDAMNNVTRAGGIFRGNAVAL